MRALPGRLRNMALLLAGPFAVLDRVALVVLLLAPGETDFDLDAAVLVMQVERGQRVSGAFHLADEAVDLLAVEQELARARRVRR